MFEKPHSVQHIVRAAPEAAGFIIITGGEWEGPLRQHLANLPPHSTRGKVGPREEGRVAGRGVGRGQAWVWLPTLALAGCS